MALAQHYVPLVEHTFLELPHGLNVSVDLKGYLYHADEVVYWDLLMLLKTHAKVKKGFKLCEFIRDRRSEWNDLCATAGITDGVKPSKQAAAHWGAHFLHDPKIRQEFTAGAAAIMYILMKGAVKVKTNEERMRYRAMLRAFLRLLGVDYSSLRYRIHELMAAHCQECVTLVAQAYKFCEHSAYVQIGIPAEEDWEALCDTINYMFLQSHTCASNTSVLKGLAAWIMQRAANKFEGACEDSSNGTRAARIAAQGRRLYGDKKIRIDEDFKNLTTVSLHYTKSITNSASYLRSSGSGCTAASGRRWMDLHVRRSQAAAIEHYSTLRHARVAVDGCRLGKPARDTNVFLLKEPRLGTAFPLAPQASMLKIERPAKIL